MPAPPGEVPVSAAAAHAEDSQTSTQDRKAKTKSAMTLLIHRVEILKPPSTVVNRRLRSSILPVRGRHGGLQTHGSFGYIFEQSGS
jgi:hypothetical protein